MPADGIVNWRGAALDVSVRDAASRAMGSVEEFGHAYWEATAPVSSDPRSAGDLKKSWFSSVDSLAHSIRLKFGASARHAIYVELGTYKMTPRAPVRGTAAEMTAIMPSVVSNELRRIGENPV